LSPVNHKIIGRDALPRLCLPLVIGSYKAQHFHAVFSLAGDEQLRVQVARGVPSFCRSYRGLEHKSAAGPECLEVPIESDDPQRQDVEKASLLPAHARPLETTMNDRLARPLHRAGTDSEPTVPWLLVSDTSPVPLHIADQLGQRVADGLLPRPHPLERT